MPDDQWWEERAERHFAESEMRAGMRPMVGPVPQIVYLPEPDRRQAHCIRCGGDVGRAGDVHPACIRPDDPVDVVGQVWCRTCGYPKGDQGHPADDCPPGTTDGRWQT